MDSSVLERRVHDFDAVKRQLVQEKDVRGSGIVISGTIPDPQPLTVADGGQLVV